MNVPSNTTSAANGGTPILSGQSQAALSALKQTLQQEQNVLEILPQSSLAPGVGGSVDISA